MNKRQEYHQQSLFKRGIPEEKSVNKKKPLWMWVTVRREHSHGSWGTWMCFSLVDSRLLQATRLSNPLVQKMKSKLFMELLCSINTQVENKRGGNKKDMAHSMLIHLSIFGGPQVAYKEFFSVRMCQSCIQGSPRCPKLLGDLAPFSLPPNYWVTGGGEPGVCDLWGCGQSSFRAGKLPFLAVCLCLSLWAF